MRTSTSLEALAILLVLGCGSDSTAPTGGGGSPPTGGGGTPSIVSVVVTPPTPTIGLDLTTQLSASSTDSKGVVVTNTTASWSSADTSVAIVSQSGIVTARGGGSSVVIAEISGVRGTTTVTVGAQTGNYALFDVDGSPPPILISSGQCGNASIQCSTQSTLTSATLVIGTANAISIEEIYRDVQFINGVGTTFMDTVRTSGTYALSGHDVLLTGTVSDASVSAPVQLVGAADGSRMAFEVVRGTTHIFSYQRQ